MLSLYNKLYIILINVWTFLVCPSFEDLPLKYQAINLSFYTNGCRIGAESYVCMGEELVLALTTHVLLGHQRAMTMTFAHYFHIFFKTFGRMGRGGNL